ncbi:MAG: arginine--tRNA ligase [Spirochaetales bacterium]
MDYKELVAKLITLEGYTKEQIKDMLVPIQDIALGDYALPCFQFSKVLKKSPQEVGIYLKDNLKTNKYISKVEVVNGYLNFYLDKQLVTENVIKEIDKNGAKIFTENVGQGKTVCIDYSSVNLAKYMHIGHLSTTMIGESIARLCESFGYKVIRINYVGDYGTPFGKMIAAYYKWGKKEDIEKRGVDAIQDLYVKFSSEAETDETLIEEARAIFKNIEAKKGEDYKIYRWFLEISLKEAKRLLDYLGVEFDSWKGESAYMDDMDATVEKLEKLGLLEVSEGAKVVNLEKYDLGVYLIQKSDGASLYSTRDVAAAISRYNDYHFDNMYYVTAVQQKRHFQQLFKVLELMGEKFVNGLEHIYYGMFSLPDAKIASRRGKQAVLVDLFESVENRVEEIIEEKNFSDSYREEVKNKIAKASLIYATIKNGRNKDSVFDIEQSLSFEGDTAPYILYSYARSRSILRKGSTNIRLEPDYSVFKDNKEAFELIRQIINAKDTFNLALINKEPSIVCKMSMDLCKAINKFYTTQKVIDGNPNTTQAKMDLLQAVLTTLKFALNLICIDTLEEM